MTKRAGRSLKERMQDRKIDKALDTMHSREQALSLWYLIPVAIGCLIALFGLRAFKGRA